MAAFTTGCAADKSRVPERIAIIPLENLSGDASLAPAGSVVAGLLAVQTAGSPRTHVFEAADVADAQRGGATMILQGYLSRRSGAVEAHLWLRDERSRRVVKHAVAAVPSADQAASLVPALASGTGLQIVEHPEPSSAALLHAYFSARRNADHAEALRALDAVVAQDPGFGSAHLARAGRLAALGRRDEALAAVQAARAARLHAWEKAQADLLEGTLTNDVARRATALQSLANALPADVEPVRALASLYMQQRRYRDAAAAFGRVVELSPADEETLNLRGYALMYAGDFEGAKGAFEAYAEAIPASGNALDSLGELHFYFGRYPEAERYFLEAQAKDPNLINGAEPFRAALCRWMTGDLQHADEHFDRYVAELQKRNDPIVAVRQTMWRKMTGRPYTAGIADPVVRAMLSMWMLTAGDRSAAETHAKVALGMAKSPPVAGLARIAATLAEPSAPASVWQQRVAQSGNPDARLLGWALLLDRKPAEAAAVFGRLLASRGGAEGMEERIALAWALTDAGQIEEAARVLPQGFVPPTALDPGVTSLLYPRVLDVMAKVHRHRGNTAEADRLAGLYASYNK